MAEKSNTSDARKALIPRPALRSPATPVRGGRRPDDKSDAMANVRFALHAIRQWWKVAAPIGVGLAVLVAGLIWLLFEPVYEATAWINVESNPQYVAFPERRVSRTFVDTQRELIRSPLVLDPAVAELAQLPELREVTDGGADPVEWLAKGIEVEMVGGSDYMTISFRLGGTQEGDTPSHTARIVNAVVDSYFQIRDDQAAADIQQLIDVLEQEKQRRAVELQGLRETVRSMTKTQTGRDPYSANPALEALGVVNPNLASLQTQLINAEVDRTVLQAQFTAFKAKLDSDTVEVPQWMIERAINEHPEVQARKAELLAKEAKLAEILERSAKGVDDPAYKDLSKKIEEDKTLLKRLIEGEESKSGLKSLVKQEIASTLENERKAQLEAMQTELDAKDLMIQELTGRCEAEKKKAQELSGETLELEFKRADLARKQDVYDKITERQVQLLTEQHAPSRVKLRRRAPVPKMPVELHPWKKMALASLACFCLPFGLAVLWERLVRRVSDPDHLQEQSNLAVIGEISRLPARRVGLRSADAWGLRQDLRLFEESIDSLRTNLILSESLKDVRVVAVTSAANHEGKTSVAAQLAVSIARASGEPTLLIDGDMRSPDLHKVFEIPLEPGLAEILGQECTLEDAIVTSWSDYVHLIPAGRLHTSPHKLLGNGAIKGLLDAIPTTYRYIILDTPPVLAASESLVLAKAADATLICAMRDVSRLDQVRKAYERLVAAGSRPAGTVLNGVPTKRYAYRYGSYAYSYSRD